MKRRLRITAVFLILAAVVVFSLPLLRDYLPFDPTGLYLYQATKMRTISPDMIRRAINYYDSMIEPGDFDPFIYSSLEKLNQALGFDLMLPSELPDGWKFSFVNVHCQSRLDDDDEGMLFISAAYKQDPTKVNPIRMINIRAYTDISELYISVEQSEPGKRRFIAGVPVYIYRNIDEWNGLCTIGNLYLQFHTADDEESLIPYLRTILEGRIPQDEIAHSAAGS